MVVRDPRIGRQIRQPPRTKGGEARGVERERNGVKRRWRGPQPTGASVVCRLMVQTNGFSLGYKFTLVIKRLRTIQIV